MTKKKEPKYSEGQEWGALRKSWTGYRIAKVEDNHKEMKKFEGQINELQGTLGLDKTKFHKPKESSLLASSK